MDRQANKKKVNDLLKEQQMTPYEKTISKLNRIIDMFSLTQGQEMGEKRIKIILCRHTFPPPYIYDSNLKNCRQI